MKAIFALLALSVAAQAFPSIPFKNSFNQLIEMTEEQIMGNFLVGFLTKLFQNILKQPN
jgi:hypothetical protein